MSEIRLYMEASLFYERPDYQASGESIFHWLKEAYDTMIEIEPYSKELNIEDHIKHYNNIIYKSYYEIFGLSENTVNEVMNLDFDEYILAKEIIIEIFVDKYAVD